MNDGSEHPKGREPIKGRGNRKERVVCTSWFHGWTSVFRNGGLTPLQRHQPKGKIAGTGGIKEESPRSHRVFGHSTHLFIPISSTGKASVMNCFSMATASWMIALTRSSGHLILHLVYRRQAKSQCRPSSREMSSLEKARPCGGKTGIRRGDERISEGSDVLHTSKPSMLP